MGIKKLKSWASNLSLKERLALQKFVVRLYGMEIDDCVGKMAKSIAGKFIRLK